MNDADVDEALAHRRNEIMFELVSAYPWRLTLLRVYELRSMDFVIDDGAIQEDDL